MVSPNLRVLFIKLELVAISVRMNRGANNLVLLPSVLLLWDRIGRFGDAITLLDARNTQRFTQLANLVQAAVITMGLYDGHDIVCQDILYEARRIIEQIWHSLPTGAHTGV